MKVVFDMDNTLTDDFGGKRRPGMVGLLDRLAADGVALALWTHSTRDRARQILAMHDLARYFPEALFREDYDPHNLGPGKDIRRLGGRVLVDDDPKQIAFVEGLGLTGLLVASYRGGAADPAELDRVYRAIRGLARKDKWLGWLGGR